MGLRHLLAVALLLGAPGTAAGSTAGSTAGFPGGAQSGPAEAGAAIDPAAERGADRGAQLWRAGDQEGAVAAWVEALEAARSAGAAPRERARLAYNLGVAEARRGEAMRAVAWFEAALRAAPRFEDARFNLSLARAEAGLPPRVGDGLAESLEAAAGAVTRAESEWLALLGGVVLAAAGLLEALRGGALARRVLLMAVAVQPLLLAPLSMQLLRAEPEPHMVVDPAGLRLRAAPEEGAERLGTLPAGAVVGFLDELPGWTKVSVDGEARWVPSGGLFALRL